MGIEFENRSKQKNVELAMKLVRNLFGEDVPEPVNSVQSNWAKDPFSFGAYSYRKVGVKKDD